MADPPHVSESAAESRPGVIDRAFSVLGAFDERHRALPLTTIARRAGLPVNTALRIIRSLIDVGALERRDDGLYVVGLRLFEIATLAPRGHGLRRTAMPFLESLHDVTKQHVLLTVREDNEAVLVERLSARDAGQVSYRIGGRLPLDRTGAGMVLLAYAPNDIQEAIIARASEPTGGSGPRGAAPGHELRRHLAAIRRDGGGPSNQHSFDGMESFAAPVWGFGQEIVAAVSVVVPVVNRSLSSLESAVRITARAISAALSVRSR
jgi:DNA-binding IclR family transcriptional regulator